MKKIIKVLVLSLAVLSFSIVAFAENSTIVPITKNATSTDDCNIFEIEFDLENESESTDIVFVLDKSSSADNTKLSAEFEQLLDQMIQKDIKYNIGVIVFYNTIVEETDGLVELNEDTIADLKQSINSYKKSGTNLHGALLKASEWLDADKQTANTQKHVVILSDFGSYLVDDGDGKGLMRYYNGDSVQKGDIETEIKLKYPGGLNPAINDIHKLITDQVLLNGQVVSDNLLENIGFDVNEYYYEMDDSMNPDFTNTTVKDNLYKYSTIFDGVTFENAPIMMEKGIYHSGKILLEMSELGYNVHSITKEYGNQHAVNLTNAYVGWINREIGKTYNLDNEDIETIFDQISAKMINIIESGELVDEIATEFDFVAGSETAVFEGVDLVREEDGNAAVFYKENDLVNPFLKATYDNDTHTITWEILQAIESGKHLEMKFKVEFNSDNVTEANENNIYKTNKEATLNYILSGENKSVSMISPEVEVSDTCDGIPPRPGVEEGDVIAHYVDEEGNTIELDVLDHGFVGDEYHTNVKDIDGYEFIYITDNSANEDGEFINGTLHVTYVYRLIETPTTDVPSTATYTRIPYELVIGLSLLCLVGITVITEKSKRVFNNK